LAEVALKTSVVIQAGGLGQRLGTAKPLVELDGRPLIEYVLAQVGELGDECLITTNHPEDLAYLRVRMVSDPGDTAGAGALTGLSTALRAVAGERALVVACDMPFIRTDLAGRLIDLAERDPSGAIVIPRWHHRLEPLLSVYPKSVLPEIAELLRTGSQRLRDLLERCPLRVVEPDEISRLDPQGLSFVNVNTPDDLAEAEEIRARLVGGLG
jgi:molybdopterin-guanine dinucleotide biosynthesis protein A